MGTTRWASGSVAGVDLKDAGGRDCRVDVVDGEAFRGSIVGDSVVALDLTVHTQLLDRSDKAVHFGIHIAQIPAATITDIIEAIEDAVSVGDSFPVILADETFIDDISVLCVPDYAQMDGKPYQRGSMAAGYVKDVVFRFVSVGVYTP